MNTLIICLIGFLLGLLYSKGKENPLAQALSDIGRLIEWVWEKIRRLWRRYVRPNNKESESIS